jgi:hypothetical protein
VPTCDAENANAGWNSACPYGVDERLKSCGLGFAVVEEFRVGFSSFDRLRRSNRFLQFVCAPVDRDNLF